MKLATNLTFDNIIKSYKERYDYEFDEYQLFELKTGFDDGLNIDLFAYPYFNDEVMYAIRSVLYTYREYLHGTRAQQRAVQYVVDGYDGLQIRELVIGLSTTKLSTSDAAYKKFVKF